jgi:uncharacterized OB-fold protein
MEIRPFTAASFYAFLAEGRLMAARCPASGVLVLPPRALCPVHFETHMIWFELCGRATLEGFSLIHIGSQQMAQAGYSRENPSIAAIVRLDEGPAISAQILGVDARHPETIHIGMPLRVIFHERGPGEIILAFEPAG